MRGQYPKEFRERAVRLVTESLDEHDVQWSTIAQVATRLGVEPGVA
jgi:transposase-like protein